MLKPPMALFTDHPASVGESYFQHMRHALFFTGQFALCTLACLLHAIVPGVCTTSASERTQRLIARMHNRGDTNATNAQDQSVRLTPAGWSSDRWPREVWPLEAMMCTERR